MIVLTAAAVLAVSDSVIVAAIGVVGTVVVAILSIIGAVVNHKLNRQYEATGEARATALAAKEQVAAVKDEVTTNHGKRLGKHVEDLVDGFARLEESHALIRDDLGEMRTRSRANQGRIEFLMKLWGDTTADQALKDKALEDALNDVKGIIKTELERGDKAYRGVIAEQEALRRTLESMRSEASLVEVRGLAADEAREIRDHAAKRLDVRIVDAHDDKDNDEQVPE